MRGNLVSFPFPIFLLLPEERDFNLFPQTPESVRRSFGLGRESHLTCSRSWFVTFCDVHCAHRQDRRGRKLERMIEMITNLALVGTALPVPSPDFDIRIYLWISLFFFFKKQLVSTLRESILVLFYFNDPFFVSITFKSLVIRPETPAYSSVYIPLHIHTPCHATVTDREPLYTFHVSHISHLAQQPSLPLVLCLLLHSHPPLPPPRPQQTL